MSTLFSENGLLLKYSRQTIGFMNDTTTSAWQLAHLRILARCFKSATGRELVSPEAEGTDFLRQLNDASFVLVSHGKEADPILNYGNAAALKLWEMTIDELRSTPSRLTAETPNQEERAALLAQVAAHGVIDNYSGIRISKRGRRFRIERATVWNLTNDQGEYCGQAAMFTDWKDI
jgi:MEKHLA domain